ncbi:TctC protein [Alicycliphilus sp. B1]|nr:TctC protein [Alicycliphilus sp. B1]
MLLRRHILSLAALTCALGAPAVQAQGAYPSKPIRMIVPFPPGGGTDILARLVSSKLTEVNKWTVVADNKPGAGGTIGITEAVKAAPTGYDLVMGQKDNLVIGPWLYKNLPWDPTKDLTAVAHVAYTPVVIATSASSRFKTLADVVGRRQGCARHHHLWLAGQRHLHPPRGRPVRKGRGRQAQPRSLQGLEPGAHGRAGRQRRPAGIVPAIGHGADQGR